MLTYENSVQFSSKESPGIGLRNFFSPEDGFVWSTGKWSEITFGFSPGTTKGSKVADLMIDLDVFKLPPSLEGQSVMAYLNGLRIGSAFVTQRMTWVLPVDSTSLRPADNLLTIDTPESKRASELGLSDSRLLGMQLFSLQVRPTF